MFIFVQIVKGDLELSIAAEANIGGWGGGGGGGKQELHNCNNFSKFFHCLLASCSSI